MPLFIDDRSLSVPMFSRVCSYCKHVNNGVDRTCKAFPNGIPMQIWMGDDAHVTPFAGDNGIQFSPKRASNETP